VFHLDQNRGAEDDVKKICPTPLSLGLIVHEPFILPSKEEGIMSRKR
jgi:hypothetical protein